MDQCNLRLLTCIQKVGEAGQTQAGGAAGRDADLIVCAAKKLSDDAAVSRGGAVVSDIVSQCAHSVSSSPVVS